VKDVDTVSFEDIRVILCLEFDRRAAARELANFKTALAVSSATIQAMEITGSFDFMIELAMKDMATYTAWLESVSDGLSKYVARYEVNFVSKRFIRQRKEPDAIWVPSNGDLQRIDRSLIDKVTAEGDYVRIHSQGGSWLLHDTMRSLAELLGSKDFVQIHRSTIVRCAFVDRLIHHGRTWSVRLEDGSCERVSKSQVVNVLQAVRNHSPNVDQALSIPVPITEASVAHS
jgi:DNA-binding LytR/AlgR family response regulator